MREKRNRFAGGGFAASVSSLALDRLLTSRSDTHYLLLPVSKEAAGTVAKRCSGGKSFLRKAVPDLPGPGLTEIRTDYFFSYSFLTLSVRNG